MVNYRVYNELISYLPASNRKKAKKFVEIAHQHDPNYFKNFHQLSFLIDICSEDYFKRLLDVKRSDGEYLFGPEGASRFKSNGGTVGYAHRISTLEDSLGNCVFNSGLNVARFQKIYGSKGNAIYQRIRDAKRIVRLENKNGSIFRDGEDIYLYSIFSCTKSAKEYVDFSKRNPHFQGDQIVKLLENAVPPSYAISLLEEGYRATTILNYFKIGKTNFDFSNNGKPKVLYLKGIEDDYREVNSNNRAINGDVSFRNLKCLDEICDLKIRPVVSDSDLYEKLNVDDDINHVVIFAHSNNKLMRMRRKHTNYDYDDSSSFSLDSSYKFNKHFFRERNILLLGCKTGREDINIAKHIYGSTGAKSIIAPKRAIYSDDFYLDLNERGRLGVYLGRGVCRDDCRVYGKIN